MNQQYSQFPSVQDAKSVPRPFFKKKRFLIPAGVLVLGMAMGACSGGSEQGSDVNPAAAPAVAAPADAAGAPAAPAPAAAAPAAAPAAAAPAVGAPFSVKMRNGDVARITVVSPVRTDAVTTGVLATPAKSGSYLLLDVLWETEAGKTSSNPHYFSAKDDGGRKADLQLFADNQLPAGDVLPGDKSRGFIAFDVAAGPVTVMISDPLLQEASRIQIPG